MSWFEEIAAWLSERFVSNEVGKELDRLSQSLRSDELDERLSAVKRLAFLASPDAVALLIGALRDPDSGVRAAAAVALGYQHAAEGVSPMAVLLDDPTPIVRRRVVEALDEIGQPREGGWTRRLRESLAPEGGNPLVPELLGRALLDSEGAVRVATLSALPRHGARGIAILRGFTDGTVDAAERGRAIDAAEPELVAALSAREPSHRQAAVEALAALRGADAIRPLAQAVSDPDPSVRRAAVLAVTELGPRLALEELLGRLDDPDPSVAIKVVEGLVCAKSLEALSEDEEARVHREMLRIARFRAESDVGPVAAWALGEMGRVAAVATLTDLLAAGGKERLHEAAAKALGRLGDARAVTPLLELLRLTEAEPVAIAAVRSLAALGDLRVLPLLFEQAFTEARPAVEAALEEALATFCSTAEPAFRAEVAGADEAKRIAAVRRAVSDPRLVPELVALLASAPEPAVRTAILDVLGIHGFGVLELARRTLSLPDKGESRRIVAIHLFSVLAPDDAVERLDALLSDGNEPPPVWHQCVQALRRLGTPAAVEALARHSGHPEPSVREAIAGVPPPAPAPPPAAA